MESSRYVDGPVSGKVQKAAGDRKILELGDRLDFVEIAPDVFKMVGFEVYAGNDRKLVPCVACECKSERDRRACEVCRGVGRSTAVENYLYRRGIQHPARVWLARPSFDLFKRYVAEELAIRANRFDQPTIFYL